MANTTISGEINHGVALDFGGYGPSVTVAISGNISAATYGVYGNVSPAYVTNYGVIRAGVVAIELQDMSTLDNAGIVYGTSFGIALGGSAAVLNSGTIAAGAEYALGLVNGGSIDNVGLITSRNAGVILRSQATLSNTGSIYGATIGVAAQSLDVLVNTGTISAGSGEALGLYGASSIDNLGQIESANLGVAIQNAALSNAGSVEGAAVGVYIDAGAIYNTGTIAGGTAGIDFLISTVATSPLPFPNQITNAAAGTVSSQQVGVVLRGLLDAPPISMVNAGYISGLVSGVLLADATLFNSGKISGGAGIAIETGSVYNTGFISGATYGVYLGGGTLTNAGTISGASYAVDGNGVFDVVIDPGAVFSGKLADESGTGTISLEGTLSSTLSGVGVSITGFSNIQFDRGSNWTVEGTVNDLADGPTFGYGGTIMLTDFAAAFAITPNGSFATTLSNGATTDVVNTSDRGVYTENGNTYLINGAATFTPTPGSTSLISGFASLSVTPGEGNDALGVTIGVKGTVDTKFAPAIVVQARVQDANIVNYGLIESSYRLTIEDTRSLTNFGTIVGDANADIFVNAGIVLGVAAADFSYSNTATFVGASIINTGTILGQADAYNVTNAGLITVGKKNISAIILDRYGAGNFAATSVIRGNVYGVRLGDFASIQNFGDIYGRAAGVWEFGDAGDGATNVNYGSIGGSDGFYSVWGATILNAGTISGERFAIDNAAAPTPGDSNLALHLIVKPGAVFDGAVHDETGVANLTLAGSVAGDLDMGSSFTGFAAISFAAGSEWRLQGTASDLAGGQTIGGFGAGDTIVLDGFSATSHSFVTGTGLELGDGADSVTLELRGRLNTGDFLVTATPGETTITSAACYVAGTRIGTPDGEVAVEALAIGDLVRVQSGGARPVKWIGRRGYDGPLIHGNRAVLPICIKAGAIADGVPMRDLWVSPGHAISVGAALVHASRLLNGVSVVQADAIDTVTYYHVELDRHEIIFAEGCPAESFMDEHFRVQFQNADEFSRLYPGEAAPAAICQRRLDSGFLLHAIQRRLRERAGIAEISGTGGLRGYVDHAGPPACFGWAQDLAAPDEPVCLDVLLDGRLAGQVLANRYRADVAAAGYGSGYHGFEFTLPVWTTGEIAVRRSADGEELKRADGAIKRAA